MTPHKKQDIFRLGLCSQAAPEVTSGPKMVNVRKGVARQRERKRGWEWTKTGQGRAAHVFPLLRFYARPSRLTGNALHSFHENAFSFTGNVIKKKKDESRAVVDGRAHFLPLFLPECFHYSLRRTTVQCNHFVKWGILFHFLRRDERAGPWCCSDNSLVSLIVSTWNQHRWFSSCSAGPLTLTAGHTIHGKKKSPEPHDLTLETWASLWDEVLATTTHYAWVWFFSWDKPRQMYS